MNPNHYTYRIAWSAEDGKFAGLCTEFPGLSWMAATQGAALKGIVKLVSDVVHDMSAQGETLPRPIGERHYSGKFQIRIPPERHRLLAMQAAEAGISLNRLISDRLASRTIKGDGAK